jgi:hypothetical protein
MKVVICENNQVFLDRYQSILFEHEFELILLFRNLKPEISLLPHQIRGGVYENDELQLLFLNALPFNLQLFPIGEINQESIVTLVHYLDNHIIEIHGVQGSLALCEQFNEVYEKQFHQKLTLRLQMDVMKLKQLKDIPIHGRLIQGTMEDLSLLTQWYKAFAKESLHDDVTEEVAKETISKMIGTGLVFMYENKEKVKTSCIKYQIGTPHGCILSLVYTDPTYRGFGYAKEMTYLMCQECLKLTPHVALFVDQLNPISNHIYDEIGFEVVASSYDFVIVK